jgi:hypothetical protein
MLKSPIESTAKQCLDEHELGKTANAKRAQEAEAPGQKREEAVTRSMSKFMQYSSYLKRVLLGRTGLYPLGKDRAMFIKHGIYLITYIFEEC